MQLQDFIVSHRDQLRSTLGDEWPSFLSELLEFLDLGQSDDKLVAFAASRLRAYPGLPVLDVPISAVSEAEATRCLPPSTSIMQNKHVVATTKNRWESFRELLERERGATAREKRPVQPAPMGLPANNKSGSMSG